MITGQLRYRGIWAYSLLVALMSYLNQDLLTATTVGTLLAPVALVITLDLYKHRSDNPKTDA